LPGKAAPAPTEILDAIVVGLGAAGSATLYQLARRGARVLGIDRFSPPHSIGSSHGETRITRLAIGEGAEYTPLAARSHEIWRDLEAQSGERLLEITGGLWISSAARKAETHVANFFDNTLAAARRFGIAHELLDASAIRQRFPQFNVAANEVGYYEPGAGYVRPEACVRAQLELAAKLGAEIHRDETVRQFSPVNGGVTVRTDRGEHLARTVIVCAGPWLPELLDPDLAALFTITRQVLYWFELNAPAERYAPPRFPVWIWELQDRAHVIYGFPSLDGRSLKLATEQYRTTTTPQSAMREVTGEEKSAMYRDLVAPFLPELAPRCDRALACLYTATPDFHFVVDRHPRMPGVILVSPCSGHGFKHSAAIGEAVARMALDEGDVAELAPFALARFSHAA
jgi:sarcosine oxidase